MEKQTSNILVSIIVPAYNTEKWLPECLDSLASQTHSNVEVIVVDDGSTDSTGKICDEYAAKDSRFKTIHTENRGMSCARNAGIDEAKGAFLMFSDSDDVLHPDAVRYMLDVATSMGADIVSARFTHKRNGAFRKPLKKGKLKSLNSKEATRSLLYQHDVSGSTCDKIFARHLFDNDMRFVNGFCYEDLEIMFRILGKAHKIVASNQPVYYYRKREGSVINTFNQKRLDVLKVTNMINYTVRREMHELKPAADDRHFSACYNILLLIYRNRCVHEFADTERRCRRTIRALRGSRLKDRNARFKSRMGGLLGYVGVIKVAKFISHSSILMSHITSRPH